MLAAVHEMMAVRPAGWEPSRHARCEYLLPGIGDQYKLAFKPIGRKLLKLKTNLAIGTES